VCTCGDPKPVDVLCDAEYYDDPACPTCGKSVTQCNRLFQKLGTALVPGGAALDVPTSKDDKYFQRWGRVLAYPAQLIAPPDIV
jgi:hypothetical protein